LNYDDIKTELSKIKKIQNSEIPIFNKSAIVVMCADNGVAEDYKDKESISDLAVKIANADTKYNRTAKAASSDLFTVDVGIKVDVVSEWMIDRKTAKGTRNILLESAMTYEEASFAVRSGIEIVKSLSVGEYNIACAASVSSYGSIPAEAIVSAVTGYNKISESAKKVLKLNIFTNPIEMLQKVGSFEIAAMTGMFFGGLICGMPIIIDNDISAAAAITAYSIEPKTLGIMVAAHCDGILSRLVFEKLGLKPILDTCISEPVIGAAMALSVLNIASKAE